MKVLAFCGPAGSGKDELCDWLRDAKDREGRPLFPAVAKWGFADYPKSLCSQILGVPLSSFYADKNLPSKFRWRDLILLETAIPQRYEPDRYLLNREVLQKWCEFFRKLNPRVWAGRFRDRYLFDGGREGGVFAINDLRFWEEFYVLQDVEAKTIRLTRLKDCSAWREHPSELEWRNFPVDATIDNQKQKLPETIVELESVLRGWKWIR